MSRPIDADAIHYVEVGKGVEIALASDIDKMPTLSPDDVRGVVHCSDCSVPHNEWTGCPKLGGLVTQPDFYCAFGERMSRAEAEKAMEVNRE